MFEPAALIAVQKRCAAAVLETEEHTYLSTYLYTCMPEYLYTCIPVYLNTCIPEYLYTCIPVSLYTCLPCPASTRRLEAALWRSPPGAQLDAAYTIDAVLLVHSGMFL